MKNEHTPEPWIDILAVSKEPGLTQILENITSQPVPRKQAAADSRKIVGWSVANHMRANIVCDALEGASRRLPDARPMIHRLPVPSSSMDPVVVPKTARQQLIRKQNYLSRFTVFLLTILSERSGDTQTTLLAPFVVPSLPYWLYQNHQKHLCHVDSHAVKKTPGVQTKPSFLA